MLIIGGKSVPGAPGPKLAVTAAFVRILTKVYRVLSFRYARI